MKVFTKQLNKSGISHHMMFETKYVKEIIDIVEKNHQDKFYNVFLNKVTEITGAGASEYELYYNYMIIKNPSAITMRKLNWKNTTTLDVNSDYDYISYHWYGRLK